MIEVQRKAAAGLGFTQESWDEGWSKSGRVMESATACAVTAVTVDAVEHNAVTTKGAIEPSQSTTKDADKISGTPTSTFTLENVGNCSAYDLRQELERRLGGTSTY